MTNTEKAKTWAECARRDGDEEAAAGIEALLARAEQAERERDEVMRALDRAGVSPVHPESGKPLLTLAERVDVLAGARERAEAALSVSRMAYEEMERSQHAGAERNRELRAELERAKADNAALVEYMRALPDWQKKGRLMALTDHPGAALLEENTRLRERWQYVANLLGVADGGQYRADWDAPVMRLLERLRALESRLTMASAALRHTYRPETRDWNLVARAIRILESVTTPGALEREQAEMAESLRNALAVLEAFRALEWARGDWQGVCPYSRHKDVVCRGTDGKVSAVGPPSPVPHSEGCPYRLLQALEGGR